MCNLRSSVAGLLLWINESARVGFHIRWAVPAASVAIAIDDGALAPLFRWETTDEKKCSSESKRVTSCRVAIRRHCWRADHMVLLVPFVCRVVGLASPDPAIGLELPIDHGKLEKGRWPRMVSRKLFVWIHPIELDPRNAQRGSCPRTRITTARKRPPLARPSSQE